MGEEWAVVHRTRTEVAVFSQAWGNRGEMDLQLHADLLRPEFPSVGRNKIHRMDEPTSLDHRTPVEIEIQLVMVNHLAVHPQPAMELRTVARGFRSVALLMKSMV